VGAGTWPPVCSRRTPAASRLRAACRVWRTPPADSVFRATSCQRGGATLRRGQRGGMPRPPATGATTACTAALCRPGPAQPAALLPRRPPGDNGINPPAPVHSLPARDKPQSSPQQSQLSRTSRRRRTSPRRGSRRGRRVARSGASGPSMNLTPSPRPSASASPPLLALARAWRQPRATRAPLSPQQPHQTRNQCRRRVLPGNQTAGRPP
jgi:hypothetical protein